MSALLPHVKALRALSEAAHKAACVLSGDNVDPPTALVVAAMSDVFRIAADDLEAQMRAEVSPAKGGETLQARVERLEMALEPFAKMADALEGHPDIRIVTNDRLTRSSDLPNYYLTKRDLNEARDALADPVVKQGGE